jgi:fatty acid desaturase
MNHIWTAFKSDKYYLTKYFLIHTLLLVGAACLLLHFRGLNIIVNLNIYYLLLFPFAFLFGIQIPVLMHNCMHGNLKSKKTNFILGELSGFFALMSLNILRINHILHHAHSDTKKDPHSPSDKNFITFFFVGQLTGARIIEDNFFDFYGKDLKNIILFKFNIFLHYGGHFLRLFVWYLILGPNLFLSFYVPAFLIYSVAFAHVNYVTHQKDEFGNIEIINKDDNWYYNLINFIGSGVYYHKNHHGNPRLMNPMVLSRNKLL